MKKSIKLSNKQYVSLVKLLFLGEWVLNANKVGGDVHSQKERELVEYIFSHKENFSLGHWFKDLPFDEELTEERVIVFLEKVFEYNEDTFWMYLISKLAERDVIEKTYQDGKLLSEDELQEIHFKAEVKYEAAFQKRELDKLYLKE